MIYHVTRSGDPNVVTVNADSAQEAARIAADRHVGWEGVELWVYDLQNRAWPVTTER
jgi:hypothetical protein